MSRQRDVPAVLAEIFGGGAPPASSEESARTPDALASVSTLTAPVAHAVPWDEDMGLPGPIAVESPTNSGLNSGLDSGGRSTLWFSDDESARSSPTQTDETPSRPTLRDSARTSRHDRQLRRLNTREHEDFRAIMRRAGVADEYTTRRHWHRQLAAHFLYHTDGRHRQLGPPQEDDQFRVMQWNILAEGLEEDGFLSPLVTTSHAKQFRTHLQHLTKRGDYVAAAALSEQGARNVCWDATARRYVPFGSVAAETRSATAAAARAASDGMADGTGERARAVDALRERYDARAGPLLEEIDSGELTGALTTNAKALCGAHHRLLRVIAFVELLKPSVLCVEECDNFAYLVEKLGALGYACGDGDPSKAYVPLSARPGKTYAERLQDTGHAFAPCERSSARRALEARLGGREKRIGGEQRRVWPIDDDGCAIFWREDQFRLATLEFRVLPGRADVAAHVEAVDAEGEIAGSSRGDAGAVRVRLRFEPSGWGTLGRRLAGQSVVVWCAHLTGGRGTEREIRRLHELRSLWRQPSGWPEIVCLDANTTLDHGGARERNALAVFGRDRARLRCVWDDFYDRGKAPPCSVFKLRGVASGGAAEKVGVGKRELVDHVFYDGAELFNRGGPGLRLRATCQDGAEGPELDWLALLPNEVVPSDHLPVVWDFALKRFPRASAAALRDAAREELRPRLDLVPAALRVDVAGPDGKGGGLFGAWLREAERQAHAVLRNHATDAALDVALNDCDERSLTRRSGALASLFLVGCAPPVARSVSGRAQATLALAALRCALRGLSNLTRQCWDARDAWLAGLAAHAAEALFAAHDVDGGEVVDALDQALGASGAILDEPRVEGLLESFSRLAHAPKEIAAELSVPMLAALAAVDWEECGTGAQARRAVEIVLATFRAHAPEETTAEDSLVEETAMAGLKAVARSRNVSTGGALQLLSASLDDILRTRPSRSLARALCLRDPRRLAAFTRVALSVLCGKVRPVEQLLLTTQGGGPLADWEVETGPSTTRRFAAGPAAHYYPPVQGGADRPGARAPLESRASIAAPSATDETPPTISPLDVVFRALTLRGLAPPDKELKTFGYLLKTVNRLARTDAGRTALLARYLAEGTTTLGRVLRLAASFPLLHLERWRTHTRVVELLVTLLLDPLPEDNRLLGIFRGHFRVACAKDVAFRQLLDAPQAAEAAESLHQRSVGTAGRRGRLVVNEPTRNDLLRTIHKLQEGLRALRDEGTVFGKATEEEMVFEFRGRREPGPVHAQPVPDPFADWAGA